MAIRGRLLHWRVIVWVLLVAGAVAAAAAALAPIWAAARFDTRSPLPHSESIQKR